MAKRLEITSRTVCAVLSAEVWSGAERREERLNMEEKRNRNWPINNSVGTFDGNGLFVAKLSARIVVPSRSTW